MQLAQTQPADFTSHCHFGTETASAPYSEVVCIVEDDVRVRDALSKLLASLGRAVKTFGTAGEYLAWYRRDSAACLILDMLLPDMHGLELQRRLGLTGCPPIIFISGEVDIPCTVRAIKAGAVEFLTKPVNSQALESAIHAALTQDRERRRLESEQEARQARLATLSPRERQVLPLVAGGLLNKQAAAVLGICEVTLQVHRSQIMRKMAARSFAELVRMAEKLGIPAAV